MYKRSLIQVYDSPTRRPVIVQSWLNPSAIEYKGKKYRVPKVLLSGNHKDIEEWKLAKTSRNSEMFARTLLNKVLEKSKHK